MIIINPKLFKPGHSYANQANANIAELKKILSELTIDDPIVRKTKQKPSPHWIHGKKAGATVWANEPKERRVKTFKL
ncbi:unnamed protein product [Phytophthora fragariaefolia]|uniref:Unnamed protein product n=1 Tax=Phytophthora fragariaefolia TaxID=1490495 RepID=A0A9W6X6J3_9STRA|nr:unnamed protein product [Phytophthora fragariaefolia]